MQCNSVSRQIDRWTDRERVLHAACNATLSIDRPIEREGGIERRGWKERKGGGGETKTEMSS